MYYSIGYVTEFNYAYQVDANIINQDKMQYFNTFGESWGLIPAQYAVVFLDNHDTQRNGNAELTYKNGTLYQFANIFMLAHPYGYPKVMSSYYFIDTDAGPPSNPVHTSNGLNCMNGVDWVCEHRWTPIANMVAWRNTAGISSISNWQNGNNGNQIAFSRTGCFIALNRDITIWTAKLKTGLSSGNYCDIIQGDDTSNCPIVTVDNFGYATITVLPLSAVAIHTGKIVK